MKRKIISLLLCLAMALSLIPTVAFGATADTNLGWKYAVISEGAKNGYTIRQANSSEDLSDKVTVKIGSETLIKSNNDAQSSPQAISSNSTDNVTISVETGYYIAYVVLCCNDGYGYSCKTSRGDNAFGMEGSVDGSTVTIPVARICKNIPHGYRDKNNFWLMVMVAPIPNPVYVGYESGSINGDPISANPVTKDEGTWVTDKFIKQYPTTAGTAAPTHNALAISSEAEAEANLKGYTFAGWQLTYYKAYTDGSFSGQTDAGVGGIKSAGASITLFTHAKLVAQWQEVPQPTTGSLTINKVLEGDGASAAANKAFTFKIMQNGQQFGDPVTITGADTYTVNGLTVGATYTVVEEDAVIDGYKLTTTGTGDVEVTANGATVTVTNTYEKLPTASETIDIPVEKVWSDGNENHTETVTVKLLANGTVVENEIIELNANNNWTGTFEGLPKKDATTGEDIEYTVEEVAVPGYTASYTKPEITGLSVSEWGDKITPASTPSYGVTGNLLVGKKGGNYFVWTSDTLSETQKNDLMVAINNADLQGLGKSLTATNTTFASGESASFDNNAVRINSGTITFTNTNVWSLFYCGKLTPSSVTKAIITNTPVVPKTYTVNIPVTKAVSAKVGSTLPQNLPSFTFKAYQDKVVVDTLTLALNENTKVSGAQNQYQGTLKVTIPAASLSDGPVVLTIKELPGIDTKWTYDTKEYTVYVINGREKPELEIMLGNDVVNSVSFENIYTYKYTPAPKPTTPAKPVTSVKTGDMGVTLYAGLAILSMTGSAGVILRRRKNDK